MDFDIAFSGLPAEIAFDLEGKLREEGVSVFSNASAYRMGELVPILIPEINSEHLHLVSRQRKMSDSDGFIITNSNCSVSGSSIFLSELQKIIPIDTAVITTYQAMSGAGLTGVSGLKIVNNVIPFIKDEEKKIEIETKKILGKISNDGKIEYSDISIIANCARVPVVDGHLESITVFPKNKNIVDVSEIITKMRKVKSSIFDPSHFHIAPESHISIQTQPDRPQPALDVYSGEPESAKGMSVSIGRIRVNSKSISAFILVHNTIRGGAGGSVLNAEFAKSQGLIR